MTGNQAQVLQVFGFAHPAVRFGVVSAWSPSVEAARDLPDGFHQGRLHQLEALRRPDQRGSQGVMSSPDRRIATSESSLVLLESQAPVSRRRGDERLTNQTVGALITEDATLLASCLGTPFLEAPGPTEVDLFILQTTPRDLARILTWKASSKDPVEGEKNLPCPECGELFVSYRQLWGGNTESWTPRDG